MTKNSFFQIFSFKDSVKISETSDHFQVMRDQSDKGFYELIIPVVKKEDAGSYKCVAINKFGESSCQANVTITGTSIDLFKYKLSIFRFLL